MRLKRRRRKTEPNHPRPNYTAIAVMEHDLLGVQPEPGSIAAVTIALRKIGACVTHQPVETTTLGAPAPVAICTRCGTSLALNEEGDWVKP